MKGDTWRWVITAVLTVVLVAGIAASVVYVVDHMKRTNSEVARAAKAPIPVQVSGVSFGLIDEVIAAEGVARESAEIPLRTMISSVVASVSADLGDVVQEGQLVVALDNTVQYSDLMRAKSSLASAKTAFEIASERVTSVESLLTQKLATEEEYRQALLQRNKAEDDIAAAEAALVEVRQSYKAAKINAPATGVVTARNAHAGAVVKPGEELVTIDVIDPILIEASLSEDKMLSVYPGQPAELSFYAFPGRKFDAVVALIDPSVDEKTRLLSVILRLDNAGLEVKPGMRAVVHMRNRHEGLRVPGISVVSQVDRQGHVFIIGADDVARLRAVTLGAISEGYIEVKSGVSDGERVVVVGQTALRDGDSVRIGREEHVEP